MHLVSNVSPHNITNQESKERPINGIEHVISGNIGALSTGMKETLQMNGKCHGLFARINHWQRMEPFEVLRLVRDIGFADEIFSFFLKDKFLDCLTDISRVKLRGIHRKTCRTVSKGRLWQLIWIFRSNW